MQPFEPTERSIQMGLRLRKLRKMNFMTQEQAVKAAGLDMADTTYSRLELGARLPRDGELYALAKAFGVTLQHITRHDSAVDDPTFRLGETFVARDSKPGLERTEPVRSPVTPATMAAAIAARAVPATPVMTPIPAGLPPQRSSSAVMTPAEYVEKVYVPNLERRVADLEAKLERANQMLKANGYQQVLI